MAQVNDGNSILSIQQLSCRSSAQHIVMLNQFIKNDKIQSVQGEY